ncbi:hypothetical protein [Methylobacterium gossipiicola]|uniref:Uncharacterized protein n=1 Tax=Methylobacterium gossipiicola TaxID=582675 RepID=A0A1I2T7C4_9HYPH|nr:hypothetical protein [Methylobacterium gossipiicola]SFG60843.1 hypothetical protein SAMN05192565_106169 [Methylobacterium gossipiicola]
MAGRKLFSNHGPCRIDVTLFVRAGDDPKDRAGQTDFSLNAGEAQWQDYGNDSNIYLNGISLVAAFDGARIGQQYNVVTRGSRLDDAFNRNNAVDFNFANNTFFLATHQV